jgi:hypothetical protein
MNAMNSLTKWPSKVCNQFKSILLVHLCIIYGVLEGIDRRLSVQEPNDISYISLTTATTQSMMMMMITFCGYILRT